MKTNDCLRRLRYILDLDDARMITAFADGGLTVTRQQVSDWLKRDDDPDHRLCEDQALASFLNGVIVQRRGRRPGPAAVPEDRLTNNIVLKKVKIAFNLEADAMLELLSQQAVNLSKHELSAFFRKPDNRHYRECKDQVLRNLLSALQQKLRPEQPASAADPADERVESGEPAAQNPWSNARSKRAKPS